MKAAEYFDRVHPDRWSLKHFASCTRQLPQSALPVFRDLLGRRTRRPETRERALALFEKMRHANFVAPPTQLINNSNNNGTIIGGSILSGSGSETVSSEQRKKQGTMIAERSAIIGNSESPVRTRRSVSTRRPSAPTMSITVDAPSPIPTTSSIKRLRPEEERMTVDLRENHMPSVSEVLSLAGNSSSVRRYLETAVKYTTGSDCYLRQIGRHLIRLCRDAGTLDRNLLARYGTPYCGQLLPVPAIVAPPYNNSNMRSSMLPFLLETVAALEPDRNDLDEQDVRATWAAITQAVLPSGPGVALSLEFKHDFQVGLDHKTTKSDITIYITNSRRKLGVVVAEVQKDWIPRHGIHKDHIKAPGEIVQQFVGLLSSVTMEHWDDIRVHYALIAQWSVEFYSIQLVYLDNCPWFVVEAGPTFKIGPDISGLRDVLRYGEFLNEVILPACLKVKEIMQTPGSLPDDALVERLPKVGQAIPLQSRLSKAPVTPVPASKRRKSVPRA
ncbi:hypothetical protein DFS34DRAFT_693411 [Phlyctochytrium arcticum]|nr:hypothetical protein DFS34DRAFT_693411 [Phlyctochytrium arcticum]